MEGEGERARSPDAARSALTQALRLLHDDDLIAVAQEALAVAPADVADHLRRLLAGRDAAERRRRRARGEERSECAVDVGGLTLCIRDRLIERIDPPDLARCIAAVRRRRRRSAGDGGAPPH